MPFTFQGGHVYIAGSANNMPKAVRKAIMEVVMAKGGATEEEAAKLLAAMERRRRYCVEAWS